ncbi:MAG: DsbA family protein [Chloroflexaceae bacterium]|nr:DsbA family protein [Chloroflexaceae bacterium]
MTTNDEALFYGFDPLCGWCFAFRPSMQALTDAHPDLPVELAYGGLVLGERVQPISVMRDYLINGLNQVRQTAGVAAGDAFYNGLLAQGTYVSNSEPPCRAIYVMEQLAPQGAYAFADSLPHAFYGRGLPLDDGDVLAELATAQGADGDEFLRHWRSDEAKQGVQEAFMQARAAGVSMYPTLFYRRGQQLTPLVRGFMAPAELVARVTALRRG